MKLAELIGISHIKIKSVGINAKMWSVALKPGLDNPKHFGQGVYISGVASCTTIFSNTPHCLF